jgi:hypothetical protein
VSAAAVLPLVLQWVRPASVIDVGCGEGIWLSVARQHGISRVKGVDGDYVNRERLAIPADQFVAHDLTKSFSDGNRYDLVMSLEVAEHLPESAAAGFIDTLTGLGDVVLFSAAIPFQGGLDHIHLRWQSYWAGLFSDRGYAAVDVLRPVIWEDERISFWYRQNTLLYVRREKLPSYPALAEARQATRDTQLSVVHPTLATYLSNGQPSDVQLDNLYLGQIVPRLPRMVWRAVKHRVG